jgi:hypothetical protein
VVPILFRKIWPLSVKHVIFSTDYRCVTVLELRDFYREEVGHMYYAVGRGGRQGIALKALVAMKNDVFWDIKPQFVLHRKHITSPLQSPAS